jgi:hypothetical protein
VAGDLLGGPGKGAPAVILEKLGTRLIRAANLKRPARHTNDLKIVKPFPRIDGVERLRTLENIRENIFYFSAGQAILLYSR